MLVIKRAVLPRLLLREQLVSHYSIVAVIHEQVRAMTISDCIR